jgi:hypothetical protein
VGKFAKLGVVLGALCATATFAHAVPITFNFTGTGQQAPTFSFSQSGLNLTVKSNVSNEAGTALTAAGKVGKWQYGLGILNGLETSSSSTDDEKEKEKEKDDEHSTIQYTDEHYVDGKGKNDVLSFAFDKSVKIISVGFSYNDSNDDFAFFFDQNKNGILANDLIWKKKDIPGSAFSAIYSFVALAGQPSTPNYIGRLFGIGAFDDNDEFKVASITVERVSAVPVPAALPLFFAGLLGLGLMVRRTRTRKI